MNVLTGLLASLGGPEKILSKAGEFVGDVLEDIGQGKVKSFSDFGKSLAKSGAKVLGAHSDKKHVGDEIPILMDNNKLGLAEVEKPAIVDTGEKIVTPAGFPDKKVIMEPKIVVRRRGRPKKDPVEDEPSETTTSVGGRRRRTTTSRRRKPSEAAKQTSVGGRRRRTTTNVK